MDLFVLGSALRMLMSATCLHLVAVMSLPKSRYGPKHCSAHSSIISRDRAATERNLQGRTYECEWKCEAWKSGLGHACPSAASDKFSLLLCFFLSVIFSLVMHGWTERRMKGRYITGRLTLLASSRFYSVPVQFVVAHRILQGESIILIHIRMLIEGFVSFLSWLQRIKNI
jgi:hypothetical protein